MVDALKADLVFQYIIAFEPHSSHWCLDTWDIDAARFVSIPFRWYKKACFWMQDVALNLDGQSVSLRVLALVNPVDLDHLT